jgi:hypothetical protein
MDEIESIPDFPDLMLEFVDGVGDAPEVLPLPLVMVRPLKAAAGESSGEAALDDKMERADDTSARVGASSPMP